MATESSSSRRDYERLNGESSVSSQRSALNEHTHLLLRAERSLFRSLRGDSPDNDEDDSSSSAPNTRTLGTFSGVFAPVSLSMLSSILFLRMGYIVGNAGFLETLLLFAIAYIILVATVLSICAIATNGAVEGGGVYFMISRTLGMEFGGAIGILFWFANVVSSALYLTAATEGVVHSFGVSRGTVLNLLPQGSWYSFGYSTAFNILNLCVCLVGSRLFGKTSAFIFTAVTLCTAITMLSFGSEFSYSETFVYNATHDCTPPTDNVSLPNCTKTETGEFVGFLETDFRTIGEMFSANLLPTYDFDCSNTEAEVNFFTVFGVLFSGVTGIMSGANMSGELLSPAKNIPRGTLSGCLFSLTVFMLVSLLTCLTCNPALLHHDCMYLSHFSPWPPIVTIGVLLATISASLNNLIGASRVLEAVAKDVMLGPILAFVTKGTVRDNPVAAVVFTWGFVEIFLLMGSLNTIAQLCSVLFLMSYATVNLACLGLDWASAPNFRPSFQYFSWQTSMVGLVGTATMMFFVSPLFSAVSLLLCLSLVFALNFFSPMKKQNWGSISQALLFHQVRKYLLLLDPRKSHVKFWRPQILLLVSNPRTSCSLIDFVNTLKKGGLYVVGHVYDNKGGDLSQDPCVLRHNHWLSLIDHLRVKAFVELTLSSSLREGIQHLVRISGLGAMKPNTIVMGFLDNTAHGDDFNTPYSSFATRDFDGAFPASEEENSRHRFTPQEYVCTMVDILKMQKNLCLSRHFQFLNKGALFGSTEHQEPPPAEGSAASSSTTGRSFIFGSRIKRQLFLDVWLVDFFNSQGETSLTDTTSLFLLQLACIVNMVPRWKKLCLRVFVAPSRRAEEAPDAQKDVVTHVLDLLRIRAEPHILSDWPSPLSVRSEDRLEYANDLVRRHSVDTGVAFLYLPPPPIQAPSSAEVCQTYLDSLATLTENWPPTLMVRGVSPVTSITL